MNKDMQNAGAHLRPANSRFAEQGIITKIPDGEILFSGHGDFAEEVRRRFEVHDDLPDALESIEPFLKEWLTNFPKNAGYALNDTTGEENSFDRVKARKMLAAIAKARGES